MRTPLPHIVVLLILTLLPHGLRGADEVEQKSDPAEQTEQEQQFKAARVHLQTGNVHEALEAYEALDEQQADPARVAIGMSRCYQAIGRWEDATEVLTRAIDSNKQDAALFAGLAEVQFATGRYAGCQESVQAALALDVDQPLAHLIQAHLLKEAGNLEKADEEYRWLVRYYNRAQPEDAETLMLVGEGSAQYARWNRAVQIFSFLVNTLCPDALKADKNCWQSRYLSGSLLLEKYNRAQALPELQKALAINPRAAEVLVALGSAALQQNDLDEAASFADRALKINPHLVSALQLLADLKLAEEDIAGAMASLEQAIAVNPNDQSTLGRLAAYYLLRDGVPSADELAMFFESLDATDESPATPDGRFQTMTRALNGRNPKPGYFFTIAGQTLQARRKLAAALEFYKRAIAVMPQLSEPRAELGMLYMQLGDTDEAARILETAFDADPFHIRVSNMRKVLKLLKGYEAITTDHFVIHVDSQEDQILGHYMAEYLEEQYDELVEKFGFEPPNRTHFEIYNDSKGQSAHQWFSARMVGLPWIQTIGASTGNIVALASPTATDEPFNWARVLRHEFVHVLTLQQTDFNIPHWFTEALAVTSEGYPFPNDWNRLLMERVPNGQLRSLDELNHAFVRPDSPDDWQFAYCQSALYAKYMINAFGEQTIRTMLDAYRQNLSTEQAIEKAFGVDAVTFDTGYRAYVNLEVLAGLGGSASLPSRPLAELEKDHQADPSDTQAAAEYAAALFDAGKQDEAVQLAETVSRVHPSEPLSAFVLAQSAYAKNDAAAAIGFLQDALDRQNPDPRVLQLLSQIRFEQEQYTEAAELLRLGCDYFGRDPEWFRGLAEVYAALEDTDRLVETLSTLIPLDSDNAEARRQLAAIHLEAKRYADALNCARLAMQIDVLDVEVHHIMAQALEHLNEPQKAIEEYKVALQLQPEDTRFEDAIARLETIQNNQAGEDDTRD